MIDLSSLFVAFSIGILGGAHCIGMCGGIIGALTMAVSAENYTKRLLMVLSYNVGRVISYVLIAGLFFAVVDSLQQYFALQFMRYVAGILLIMMGLYLANWWRGLLYLEKVGAIAWKYIQPLGQRLLPVSSYPQALLLGVIWGWLPCGLIYSALAYSASATSTIHAMLIMLAFALGTLPAVLASGLFAERLLVIVKNKGLRTLFSLLIIIFGVWTLYLASAHSGHGAHDGMHNSHSSHGSHHHNTHNASMNPSSTSDAPISQESSDHSHHHSHHQW